jgi:phosphoenolpyruvate carboxykinase (ATP)
VPDEVLDPQATWPDKDDYETSARELARMFAENFERFREQVPPEVTKAGPSAD